MKFLVDSIYVSNIIWEKKYSSPDMMLKWLSDSHDFIMVYAKNREAI